MQLSIQHKFAFLCIPKCGSTSVEQAIRRLCDVRLAGHPSVKHINVRTYERHVRPLLAVADPKREIELFCIMREPVDRLRSWYKYQQRSELKNPSHHNHSRYTGNVTFTEFVEAYLSEKRPAYANIGTQSNFVRRTDGTIGVSRIFRLDRMDAVAEFLSSKCGRPVVIPVSNKSVPAEKKGWFFQKSAPALPKERESGFELPEQLMARLKDQLAEDYAIFNSLD